MRYWKPIAVVAAAGLLGFGVTASATTVSTPDQNLAAAALAYAQSQGWTPPSPTPTPTPTPSPAPSPTPSPTPAGWPGASNTGVPAGTALTAYTGSGTIPAGTYAAKRFTGDFVVSAGTVTISSSEIDGTIRTSGTATLNVTDATINGGTGSESFIDLQGSNINALRVNLHGGNAGFSCSDNCTATDSWFHDPYVIGAKHYDAVGSNGVNGFTIKHNTISCTNALHAAGATGGCTADAGFFGDFGPISNVTITGNLFVSSNDSAGYCLNAGFGEGKPYTADHVVVTGNVFQKGANGKCGQYGPADYYGGTGSSWTGNTWDNGTPLNA